MKSRIMKSRIAKSRIVLLLMLVPTMAMASGAPPVCQDILNPACRASQQAYENSQRLEQTQREQDYREAQLQRERDQDCMQAQTQLQIKREKYRRNW